MFSNVQIPNFQGSVFAGAPYIPQGDDIQLPGADLISLPCGALIPYGRLVGYSEGLAVPWTSGLPVVGVAMATDPRGAGAAFGVQDVGCFMRRGRIYASWVGRLSPNRALFAVSGTGQFTDDPTQGVVTKIALFAPEPADPTLCLLDVNLP